VRGKTEMVRTAAVFSWSGAAMVCVANGENDEVGIFGALFWFIWLRLARKCIEYGFELICIHFLGFWASKK
jgi:hypothetical protein